MHLTGLTILVLLLILVFIGALSYRRKMVKITIFHKMKPLSVRGRVLNDFVKDLVRTLEVEPYQAWGILLSQYGKILDQLSPHTVLFLEFLNISKEVILLHLVEKGKWADLAKLLDTASPDTLTLENIKKAAIASGQNSIIDKVDKLLGTEIDLP